MESKPKLKRLKSLPLSNDEVRLIRKANGAILVHKTAVNRNRVSHEEDDLYPKRFVYCHPAIKLLIFLLVISVFTLLGFCVIYMDRPESSCNHHQVENIRKIPKIAIIHVPVKLGSEKSLAAAENGNSYDVLADIESNPFKLSTHEILAQLEEARIPSLKKRVKRFACWHSCFGQFKRRAFRKPFGKSAIVNSTHSRPPPPPKPSDDDGKTNDLGDGDATSGKRQKKSPGVTDYFKLRTKVVTEKSITVHDPSAGGSTSDGIQKNAASNEKAKFTNFDSRATVVKKKSNEAGGTSKATAKASPKGKGKGESGENDEAEGSKEDNEEESASEEAESAEEDASSSEEVNEKDSGDGVDKKDLAAAAKKEKQ